MSCALFSVGGGVEWLGLWNYMVGVFMSAKIWKKMVFALLAGMQ